MSQKRDPAAARAALEEAFAAQADDLGLGLEEAPLPAPRAIGVAVVKVRVEPILEVASGPEPPTIGRHDDEQIEHIVHRWDCAAPEGFLEVWRRHASEPTVVVGPDWIGPVNEEDVRRALEGEELREAIELFPFHKPRKMKFRDLRITYQGPSKAIVTFGAEEEYTNGKVFAGNSMMVLMKDARYEWKVTLFAKHNRHHDFLEQKRGRR